MSRLWVSGLYAAQAVLGLTMLGVFYKLLQHYDADIVWYWYVVAGYTFLHTVGVELFIRAWVGPWMAHRVGVAPARIKALLTNSRIARYYVWVCKTPADVTELETHGAWPWRHAAAVAPDTKEKKTE